MKNLFVSLIFLCTTWLNFASGDSLQVNDDIDVNLFRAINSIESPVLESVIKISDRSIIPGAIITPPLFYFAARSGNNYYDENSAVLLGVSNIFTGITVLATKHIFKRDRPFQKIKNVNMRGKDPFLDKYSFPSGHTAFAFSTAGILSLRYSNEPILIAGLYSYAFLIGFGRVYLGVHYPSDVLGGMVLGSANALLTFGIRKGVIDAKNKIFNEENRPDINEQINVPGFALLGAFAGAEILNAVFQNSESRLLKKTSFDFTGESIALRIKF
ncbi:MAG: Membrane-associated phospholipid phosphatase [Chlorobi bacterium OLB4]|jgi:undecaprenyl-diphosphatase|nr:MAG: Membrane-associated phospholipid phosphatase [Chlorobi bacterium OLB4]MBW7855162.1 phosphatase PAP2 family protein [Ignavibacteria bacterium]OQY77918.1 MAG: hypothetical protein B6D43_05240 [Ignavibacteriales bacterium UTCHB1]